MLFEGPVSTPLPAINFAVSLIAVTYGNCNGAICGMNNIMWEKYVCVCRGKWNV